MEANINGLAGLARIVFVEPAKDTQIKSSPQRSVVVATWLFYNHSLPLASTS